MVTGVPTDTRLKSSLHLHCTFLYSRWMQLFLWRRDCWFRECRNGAVTIHPSCANGPPGLTCLFIIVNVPRGVGVVGFPVATGYDLTSLPSRYSERVLAAILTMILTEDGPQVCILPVLHKGRLDLFRDLHLSVVAP